MQNAATSAAGLFVTAFGKTARRPLLYVFLFAQDFNLFTSFRYNISDTYVIGHAETVFRVNLALLPVVPSRIFLMSEHDFICKVKLMSFAGHDFPEHPAEP
jgi:hypothetical protein